jgi:hypothetical protein
VPGVKPVENFRKRYNDEIRPRLVALGIAALFFGFTLELVLSRILDAEFSVARTALGAVMWWVLTVALYGMRSGDGPE